MGVTPAVVAESPSRTLRRQVVRTVLVVVWSLLLIQLALSGPFIGTVVSWVAWLSLALLLLLDLGLWVLRALLSKQETIVSKDPSDNVEKARLDRLDHRHTLVIETFWAMLSISGMFIALAKFATNGGAAAHLDVKNDFMKARVEWFLALGLAIGVIGAVWAVLAKHKADNAFTSAQIAAKGALDAYSAVSTKSVEFSRLVGGNVLLTHIGDAKKKLRLLLGVPAVGFFQQRRGEYPLIKSALALSREIRTRAQDVAGTAGGIVDILCFERGICTAIADEARQKGMPKEAVEDFTAEMQPFLTAMGHLPRRDGVPPFVEYRLSSPGTAPPGGDSRPFDPGLRIAIIDDNENLGVPSEKAIFWFVTDFLDGSPTKFRAGAVETRDPAIIKLLNELIDSYKRAFKPSQGAAPRPSGEQVESPESSGTGAEAASSLEAAGLSTP